MSQTENDVVQTARNYYDSSDADNFYFRIWGGEDIHIGLYQFEGEEIASASHRTVEQMCAKIRHFPEGSQTRVLDLGAGYGGSCRILAKQFGWHCTALNLSVVQNERDRQMNREQGLDHLITVVDGAFEELPFEDNAYDIVWSQDSFLHSPQRRQVLQQADRVLKTGGEIIFTDPMAADGVDQKKELQPVLDRIHLDSMGTPGFYRDVAQELGWKELEYEDLNQQLPTHYAAVRRVLDERREDLKAVISEDYIERMKAGLGHWVENGRAGRLAWGIFHFRKNS